MRSPNGTIVALGPDPANEGPSLSQFGTIRWTDADGAHEFGAELQPQGYLMLHATQQPSWNDEAVRELRTLHDAGKHFASACGTESLINLHY